MKIYTSIELAKRNGKFYAMEHFDIMQIIYNLIKRGTVDNGREFTKKAIVHRGDWITPYFEMNEKAYNYLKNNF